MKKVFFCLVFFTIVVMHAAIAAEEAGPIEKLERGLTKTAFGWWEIPKAIQEEYKRLNHPVGALYGLFKGIGQTVIETANGIVEIVNFTNPPYRSTSESNN